MDAVVFHRMNGCSHAPIVRAICNSLYKWGGSQPAHATDIDLVCRNNWIEIQRVAATDACGATQDGNFHPAGITDWGGGETRQRGAAEFAGGGKEGAAYGVHGTSKDAGDSAPGGSLRLWNVERQ